MNRKFYLILFFLTLVVSQVFSSEIPGDKMVNEINLLLQQADELKYEDNDKGLKKVQQAQKLAIQLSSDKKLGEIYTMLGIYYYIRGNYDVALQMYLKGLAIHEKHNNEVLIARSLNGIGLIQSVFNQIKESIVTFEKSLKLDLKNKNYEGVARAYFNISIGYIELKEYDLAIKNLKQSRAYSNMNKSNHTNHMIVNRLADMMLVKKQVDSAIYYYNSVINDKKQVPNNWENSYAYAGLSEAYLSINNFVEAEKNGLISYDYAQKINAKWDLERVTRALSQVYEKNGNIKKAYQYLVLNNKFRDSLYNEHKLNEINYLQLKNKEVENLKLINKNEANFQRAKKDEIIIYSFTLLTFLLLGILFLIYRNARVKDTFNKELNIRNHDIENQKELISKQNAELLKLNESKNKLFSIISHDLRSPIGSLVQILELLKDQSLSPELQQELLEQLHIQTQGTSEMLNELLIWATTQLDGENLKKETIDVYNMVVNVLDFFALEAKKKNIVCNIASAKNKSYLIKADAAQIRIIIQNILANAIKFTPQNGLVDVRFSDSNDFINVHVINLGKEISQERIDQLLKSSERINSEPGTSLEEGTGLGLLLVKQFLANNNGMLDIKRNNEGKTEFIISFLKN
ncbi:tetratricopeptide repeat-containing sensor histidine kinase [Flavobacterium sp.]|uniref:tetratricopeptide repeat-containing sensor histidine kinase n=1 Tax=Flavobacterium sp. TaxID=239 RepID=UPI00262BA6F2|nr:tetratricopeptide repeat-containing sensor histidine kinase [Flavobacterium sp.]MDD3004901.1 tetratricopeptide repeat-containing sensor histidine kinase [Flavobacterium sp.]